jgi:hypothetical protein
MICGLVAAFRQNAGKSDFSPRFSTFVNWQLADFAGRTATLSYPDGNLVTVTQPDPDGEGAQ